MWIRLFDWAIFDASIFDATKLWYVRDLNVGSLLVLRSLTFEAPAVRSVSFVVEATFRVGA